MVEQQWSQAAVQTSKMTVCVCKISNTHKLVPNMCVLHSINGSEFVAWPLNIAPII